ncbi:hypothetical protein ON010_g4489 [Phytophthora cinnamomi]|nr:hypothetical protein ON010_g4489 [Phytophthora cinnamomi]
MTTASRGPDDSTRLGLLDPCRGDLVEALAQQHAVLLLRGEAHARNVERALLRQVALHERARVHLVEPRLAVVHGLLLGVVLEDGVAVQVQHARVGGGAGVCRLHGIVVRRVAAHDRLARAVVAEVPAHSAHAEVGERILRLGQLRRDEEELLVAIGRRSSDAVERRERRQDGGGARLALLAPQHQRRVHLVAGAVVPRVAREQVLARRVVVELDGDLVLARGLGALDVAQQLEGRHVEARDVLVQLAHVGVAADAVAQVHVVLAQAVMEEERAGCAELVRVPERHGALEEDRVCVQQHELVEVREGGGQQLDVEGPNANSGVSSLLAYSSTAGRTHGLLGAAQVAAHALDGEAVDLVLLAELLVVAQAAAHPLLAALGKHVAAPPVVRTLPLFHVLHGTAVCDLVSLSSTNGAATAGGGDGECGAGRPPADAALALLVHRGPGRQQRRAGACAHAGGRRQVLGRRRGGAAGHALRRQPALGLRAGAALGPVRALARPLGDAEEAEEEAEEEEEEEESATDCSS